jgi:hypothetical protein
VQSTAKPARDIYREEAPLTMAAERRVAALSRHLTNAVDVDIVSKISLRDFEADEVYRFITRDNLQLRARMLAHLKVLSQWPGSRIA